MMPETLPSLKKATGSNKKRKQLELLMMKMICSTEMMKLKFWTEVAKSVSEAAAAPTKSTLH